MEEDRVLARGAIVTAPGDAPAVTMNVTMAEELDQVVVHDDGVPRIDREELAHGLLPSAA